MRIYSILILALFVIQGCSSLSTYSKSSSIPGSKRVSYTPPVAEEWKLANGLTVRYLKDPEIPAVYGTLFVKGGTLWDSPNEIGVTGVTVNQMRQGGTVSYSADVLDLELEKLAAGINTGVNDEFLTVSFSALSIDADRVFKMFAEVVQHPRFDNGRFLLWKGVAIESVRRRSDDSGTVANTSFEQLLYGNSPYGRVLVEDDIKRITRADLIKKHAKLLSPDDALLVVSGDIDKDDVQKLIENNFGGWKSSRTQEYTPPPIDYDPVPGIYFISMPFPQSTIVMGHLGVPRATSDAIHIEGFNDLFGSSIGSFLFQKVRTELGLAYGIQGGISPGLVKGVNSLKGVRLLTGYRGSEPLDCESFSKAIQLVSSLMLNSPEMIKEI